MSGRIVGNPSGAPVAGASLSLGQASATSDNDGAFSFPTLPPGTSQLTVSAPGAIIERQTTLGFPQSRAGIAIDVITDAPPFSLGFYREFARDARDALSNIQPLRPWTVAPRFYIKITHDSGVEVIPRIIEGLEAILVNSVPELTGGRFTAAAVETGPEDRPRTDGWVIVRFQSVLPNPSAGGQATVGGNSGEMWLKYDPVNPGLTPGYSCYAVALSAAMHEIVHTMGYYHTSELYERGNPFFSADGSCNGANRLPSVRYHAQVMYSRPPGNLDPDRDPSSVTLQQAGTGQPMDIACPPTMLNQQK
jgi:hypothetical protein